MGVCKPSLNCEFSCSGLLAGRWVASEHRRCCMAITRAAVPPTALVPRQRWLHDDLGAVQDTAARARATALVAATTANVLGKTEQMLVSLAACRDRFEMLVRPVTMVSHGHVRCLLRQRMPTEQESRNLSCQQRQTVSCGAQAHGEP